MQPFPWSQGKAWSLLKLTHLWKSTFYWKGKADVGMQQMSGINVCGAGCGFGVGAVDPALCLCELRPAYPS